MRNESEGPAAGSPEAFCSALDEWAEIMVAREGGEFDKAWRQVRTAIRKSCLLDRVIYCGEKPSKTPCPVHKGRWAGIHLGWPGQMWSDNRPVDESPMLRQWFDAGCRCFKHGCGCTSGWQPDSACGCVASGPSAAEPPSEIL